MATARRFCRFTRTAEGNEYGLRWEEPDGLCLSAFVVLTAQSAPRSVLVGRMNPEAPWDHLGGLDAKRVQELVSGWVLPASQLLLHEGPDEAARRILAELVGGIAPPLEPARVTSEVYAPRSYAARQHWDLSFVYRGRWEGPAPSVPKVWKELRFLDLRSARRSDFARAHEEVLDLAGLPVGGP